MSSTQGPLLVFGPRSLAYDFGPSHPLTPRRFGPGIDLLRHVGAVPGLEPEPAADDALLRLHLPEYVAAVRRLSADPSGRVRMGIGLADNPAFAGMHEAAAAVAGGSLAAMEAILAGRTLHAHHPGGGLHHAMADRASGFCIYNDVALAVVRARTEGLRVLYVDLDVHHGDGVQALTYGDPGVLTLSLHESGRYLFPGTGFLDELGEGPAAGSAVNMPFEPYSGEAAWLAAVRALVPTLAAVFGPDVVVSQHGADSHAWDPAGEPPGDHDGDGGGGPAGRCGRAPLGRRAVARDGWRRVRRVPGRAARLGPHLAGGRPPRAAGADAGGVARPLVVGGRRSAPGVAAVVPRRAERRAGGRDRRSGRGRSGRSRCWPGSVPWRCRGWCARPRTAAGGRRRWRGPGRSCSPGPRTGVGAAEGPGRRRLTARPPPCAP